LARQFGVARATILAILDAAHDGAAVSAEIPHNDTSPNATKSLRKAAAGA
jgi:ribosomal protein S2